jgi:hypothetical protein
LRRLQHENVLRETTFSGVVEALLRVAAGEDGDSGQLVRGCRKHREYAPSFARAAGQGLDRQGVAEDVCWEIADSILDKIGFSRLDSRTLSVQGGMAGTSGVCQVSGARLGGLAPAAGHGRLKRGEQRAQDRAG